MLTSQTAIASSRQQARVAAACDRAADVLASMLPAGSAVALAWRDGRLDEEGRGRSEVADDALLDRALQALEVAHSDPYTHAWRSADDFAALSVSWQGAVPLDPASRQTWCALAEALTFGTLDSARLQGDIEDLEKSKQLQQALYEIADLAGNELDLAQMLQRIHAVVGSLMYAENFYIVEYDAQAESLRFLYFVDEQDNFVADPARSYRRADLPNSLTFALLARGVALSGPSEQLTERLNIPPDPTRGPESVDWLGVPMLRDGRVAGAIVVQSYDERIGFSEQDRILLAYVAQHVLTAMDRRQVKVQLERRVEERTRELQHANRELQDEILERKRAETLQVALFRISELAMASESLSQFYAEVHGVVGDLLDARNFYIALINGAGDGLEFAYSVDEHNGARPPRKFSGGMTEYLIERRSAVLATRTDIDAMVTGGQVQGIGARAHSWLGVPLFNDDEVVGAIVVQSYSPQVGYSVHDQRLLAFVAHNIGNGLARQRAQAQLRQAHGELEHRVLARTRELAELNEKLLGQIAERLRAEQRLTHQALHDALTGLPNRAHLLDRLDESIQRALHGDGMPFAVLFLDLDRFKLVNDSVGHAAGDRMLIEVAQRIVTTVRADDVVARLGGDEFAILMRCPEGVEAARELAQRLQGVLGQPMWVAGRELFPSGSLGVAMWHRRYRTGEELLRDADAAMYRAKAQITERFAVFDEAMREEALRSLDLEADMRRALNSRAFHPFYQPIVRLEDGVVVGHEALLRWEHETRGLLRPAAFIHLGEDSGLIEQVDWQLYEQVIDHLGRGGTGYVSVNVSPRHFRSVDFAERLLGLMDAVQADTTRLRLEITEVALLDDAPRTLRILRTLRERGILIQLDDFGTGYSALSYLHRFPISALKIDQSFVAGLHQGAGQDSLALVRSILALAATLGIETVGEGIETEQQRRTLRELGCHYGQGYLLGRPAPLADGAMVV
ncbi:MAG TPA: EAL domain-containing protein [Stenotrophomonas sp.]|jgi:diguanylate cyclase (GGDEF)-like protein